MRLPVRHEDTARPAHVTNGSAGGHLQYLKVAAPGSRGYWTTDQMKVAVPETPAVSLAVTVTV
jgi:hypothetical protein